MANLRGSFFSHSNKQTSKQTYKRTNIRLINICVCFYNERRYSIFFFLPSKIESMRTQSAWEWRVCSGNKALSKCLKAPLFNVLAFNQAHAQWESELDLCFCYFLHAPSLLFCFLLFICVVLSFPFPFVSFPFLKPPTPAHTPSTPLCVSVQILSNVFVVWVCVFAYVFSSDSWFHLFGLL